MLAFEQCPIERKTSDFRPLDVQNRRHSASAGCRLFCCPILFSRCRLCSFLKLLSYRHTAKPRFFFFQHIEGNPGSCICQKQQHHYKGCPEKKKGAEPLLDGKKQHSGAKHSKAKRNGRVTPFFLPIFRSIFSSSFVENLSGCLRCRLHLFRQLFPRGAAILPYLHLCAK